MEELTGQEVVSEIATRLRSRFSTTQFAEIYKDTPVQSVKTPYIFIHSVDTAHTPELRGYAWWDYIIDIRCHPNKMFTAIHTWARNLGPAILDCVSSLTVSGQQVKLRSANWKVEDNVLHVIVGYRIRVKQITEDVPDMHTLDYGHRVKQ